MVGVTKVNARINDEQLAEFLDEQESKSETVRKALRLYRLQHESVDDNRLTDAQRAGYRWMREQAGVGGTLRLEVVRTVLAQTLSRDKDLIKYTVLQPLERLGYVDVTPRNEHVRVRVRSPESVDNRPVDVEDVSDRMDALAEAGEEVAEGAD